MAQPLRVTVVYALPERCWSVAVTLDPGSRVADALAAARLEEQVPGLQVDTERLAVFGVTATLGTILREGDRVEVLRPLLADPKQARRERARTAGRA